MRKLISPLPSGKTTKKELVLPNKETRATVWQKIARLIYQSINEDSLKKNKRRRLRRRKAKVKKMSNKKRKMKYLIKACLRIKAIYKKIQNQG